MIEAAINPPKRNPPAGMKIKLRFRHPQDKPIQSAQLNGKEWQDFTHDAIIVPGDRKATINVIAAY